jgi:hypothetical protein
MRPEPARRQQTLCPTGTRARFGSLRDLAHDFGRQAARPDLRLPTLSAPLHPKETRARPEYVRGEARERAGRTGSHRARFWPSGRAPRFTPHHAACSVAPQRDPGSARVRAGRSVCRRRAGPGLIAHDFGRQAARSDLRLTTLPAPLHPKETRARPEYVQGEARERAGRTGSLLDPLSTCHLRLVAQRPGPELSAQLKNDRIEAGFGWVELALAFFEREFAGELLQRARGV